MPTYSPAVLDFELKWRVGARTSALIFLTARRFVSKITLTCDGLTVDAKSSIGVMILGGPNPNPKLPDGSWNLGPFAGTRFQLAVEGPDMPAAFAEMADLFTCGERVVQCRNSDCISSAILVSFNPRSIEYACSRFHWWAVNRKTGLSFAPPFPKTRFNGRP